jgi:hypothetical protein
MTWQTSLEPARREDYSPDEPGAQQKIPIDIRRRLYEAIVVNIALWERKLGLKEADRANWKRFTDVSARCAADDVGRSGETDHKNRRMAGNSPRWTR